MLYEEDIIVDFMLRIWTDSHNISIESSSSELVVRTQVERNGTVYRPSTAYSITDRTIIKIEPFTIVYCGDTAS